MRGLTLVEILVAVGLFATGLMLVLSLLPAGVLSLQQAENLQTATTFGQRLLEEVAEPTAFPVTETNLRYSANGMDFVATRVSREVPPTGGGDANTWETTVKVDWNGCRVPVELTLRRLKARQ